ncbi:hypothetical protein GF345_00345 [Candidatus Woesearchaeota archaeon]|nr:hypothetical protein [Candidatus Woesearchaeota archaeon]
MNKAKRPGMWMVIVVMAVLCMGLASAQSNMACWGSNDYGQLGDGSTDASDAPVEVSGIADAVDIAVGTDHTCAIKDDKTLWCWGRGNLGQLGVGYSSFTNADPLQVSALSGVLQVEAGHYHTCALVDDGDMSDGSPVYCWGYNAFGQLGDGTSGENRNSPVQVIDQSDNPISAIDIAVGNDHSCALLPDYTVACWGRNRDYNLGQGVQDWDPHPKAEPVIDVEHAVEVSSSGFFTCAKLAYGAVKCWGKNYVTIWESPAYVEGITDALEVSPKCAVLSDGTVSCWDRTPEDTGVTDAIDVSPVLISDYRCLIHSSGMVECGADTLKEIPGIMAYDVEVVSNHQCVILESGLCSAEVCGNYIDDDCDGFVDCDDEDCSADIGCKYCSSIPEDCFDGYDNDCDGLVDGRDIAECDWQECNKIGGDDSSGYFPYDWGTEATAKDDPAADPGIVCVESHPENSDLTNAEDLHFGFGSCGSSDARITYNDYESEYPDLVWNPDIDRDGDGTAEGEYALVWRDRRTRYNNEILYTAIDAAGNPIDMDGDGNSAPAVFDSEDLIVLDTIDSTRNPKPQIIWIPEENAYALFTTRYSPRNYIRVMYALFDMDGNLIPMSGENVVDDYFVDFTSDTAYGLQELQGVEWNGEYFGVVYSTYNYGGNLYFERIDIDGNRLGEKVSIVEGLNYGPYLGSITWADPVYEILWASSDTSFLNSTVACQCTDLDGDGYGDSADAFLRGGCIFPDAQDCDDDKTDDPAGCPSTVDQCSYDTSGCAICINPGMPDICNGIDDDCDPSTLDGEGETPLNETFCTGSKALCSDTIFNSTITWRYGYYDTLTAIPDDEYVSLGGDEYLILNESCLNHDSEGNPIDDDCDGIPNCDDPDCAEYPFCVCEPEAEICDGLDNDCDGLADNGCDDDNDDYCDGTMTYTGSQLCPLGGNDCNDDDPGVYPGAVEIVDGKDNDCDGLVDCDDPGMFGLSMFETNCYDGIDNDCNGQIDCLDPACTAACESCASHGGIECSSDEVCKGGNWTLIAGTDDTFCCLAPGECVRGISDSTDDFRICHDDTGECQCIDWDEDGVCDSFDNCVPTEPCADVTDPAAQADCYANYSNPDQLDTDANGVGDVCEPCLDLETALDENNNYYANDDVVLCPYFYIIADDDNDGVIITNNTGITIDGQGARLASASADSGTGILVRNESIVLRNISVSDYDTGIRVEKPGNTITAALLENYNDLNLASGATGNEIYLNHFYRSGIIDSAGGNMYCVGGEGNFYSEGIPYSRVGDADCGLAVFNTPLDGTVVARGTNLELTWSAQSSVNPIEYDLELYKDGILAQVIAPGVQGTEFTWGVPEVSTGTYEVMLRPRDTARGYYGIPNSTTIIIGQTAIAEGTVSCGENPLPGATVTAGGLSTTTDNSGEYSLEIPSGSGSVRASYAGSSTRELTYSDVSQGETITLDFDDVCPINLDCTADCTLLDGDICIADCWGFEDDAGNTCDLYPACAGVKQGLLLRDTSNPLIKHRCCEGEQIEIDEDKTRFELNESVEAEDVIRTTRIVYIDGRPVKMIVTAWS